MEQINVEEIMSQIRKEIKEKGYTQDILRFEDIPVCSIRGQSNSSYGIGSLLEQMMYHASLEWRRPLPSGVKGIIKKIIHKFIGFAVAPIADDQTNYNRLVRMAFESQEKQLEEDRKEIRALQEQMLFLESRIQRNNYDR